MGPCPYFLVDRHSNSRDNFRMFTLFLFATGIPEITVFVEPHGRIHFYLCISQNRVGNNR